jgi:hypothetical protein
MCAPSQKVRKQASQSNWLLLYFIAGAAPLCLGPAQLAAAEHICTQHYNHCMKTCPGLNAQAKDPEGATRLCETNCGKSWEACFSPSARPPSSIQQPPKPKSGVHGNSGGTATGH